jgi:hypothetical protein
VKGVDALADREGNERRAIGVAACRSRWFDFWSATVAALWVVAVVVVLLMSRAGVTVGMVGLVVPGAESA